MNDTAARSLSGLRIDDGWTIDKLIEKDAKSTGGCFSVGYIVKNVDGREAFLKALDFSGALQTPEPTITLEKMTRAFNFEKALLIKCREKRMSKIVTPILDGVIDAPGNFGLLRRVSYLLFDKADGDIRHLHDISNFDVSWCLRSLHNISVGIKQLHSAGIAHQDLKPSNVLIFRKNTKLSDLGRASSSSESSEIDRFVVPGDMTYAPPELKYGFLSTTDFNRRYSIDLYLLGSLFFFYFCNISAYQALNTKLKDAKYSSKYTGSFEHDLPYIQQAFAETLLELRKCIDLYSKSLAIDILSIATELCEPDPRIRGNPKDRMMIFGNIYNVERYITKLDVIARKAEKDLYS